MKPSTAREVKLAEFIAAQDPVYGQVLRELRGGRKETHWIWFIFPQLAGLGFSFMSEKFAISSKAEAQAYLNHPVLGSRLRECTELMLGLRSQNIDEILGYPDNLKFCSCMTLFAAAVPAEPIFKAALDKYFGGRPDQTTMSLLRENVDG